MASRRDLVSNDFNVDYKKIVIGGKSYKERQIESFKENKIQNEIVIKPEIKFEELPINSRIPSAKVSGIKSWSNQTKQREVNRYLEFKTIENEIEKKLENL